MAAERSYEIGTNEAFASRHTRRLLIIDGMSNFWLDSKPCWRSTQIQDVLMWASNRDATGTLSDVVVVVDPRYDADQYIGRDFYIAWDHFLGGRGFGKAGFSITFEGADRLHYRYPRGVSNPAQTIRFYGKEFFQPFMLGNERGGISDDAWQEILGDACLAFEFDGWWEQRHKLNLTQRLRRGDTAVVLEQGQADEAIQQIIVVREGMTKIRCFEVPRMYEGATLVD